MALVHIFFLSKRMSVARHSLYVSSNSSAEISIIQSITNANISKLAMQTTNTFIDVMLAFMPRLGMTEERMWHIVLAIAAHYIEEQVPDKPILRSSPRGKELFVGNGLYFALHPDFHESFIKQWTIITNVFVKPAFGVLSGNLEYGNPKHPQYPIATVAGTSVVKFFQNVLRYESTPCSDLLTTHAGDTPVIPRIAPQLILRWMYGYTDDDIPSEYPPEKQDLLLLGLSRRDLRHVRAQGAKLALMRYSVTGSGEARMPLPTNNYAMWLFILARCGLIKNTIYTMAPDLVRGFKRPELCALPFVMSNKALARVRAMANGGGGIETRGSLRSADDLWVFRVWMLSRELDRGSQAMAIDGIPFYANPPELAVNFDDQGVTSSVMFDPDTRLAIRFTRVFLHEFEGYHRRAAGLVTLEPRIQGSVIGGELIGFRKVLQGAANSPLFCPLLRAAVVPVANMRDWDDALATRNVLASFSGEVEIVTEFRYCGEIFDDIMDTGQIVPVAYAIVSMFIIMIERRRLVGEYWRDMHSGNLLVDSNGHGRTVEFMTNGKEYQFALRDRYVTAIDYGESANNDETVISVFSWLFEMLGDKDMMFKAWQRKNKLLQRMEDLEEWWNSELVTMAEKCGLIVRKNI